ncbi:GH3 auxin-responsive promoter family protein [Pyxidicoccus parkwayensis]|uniref:GH3 auxin-responsive promoter family protein n=1 Tax=Pyxidicoccus parkwayensis TaxID=2813578 RepID=A0ABX7NX01_9BACT|nr:GH3 auxin-responsive promoter family protein [Pyxidicoccus parkwaysis]QSQ21997.1 GH3 auxin-responsive promoter family protein [Pyxidicoccus parkwaysis]
MAASSVLLGGLHAALAPSALRFHRALRDPEAAQTECLSRVLRATAGSQQAARIPGFERVRTAREFQDAVPMVTPDSVAPDVERIAAGEARVLTREPVMRFEPSGGSSGASKLVPMTQGLLDEFQRALAPMLFELLHHRPVLRTGPSYWSISPMGRKQGTTAGGIPVGSVEDSAYFARALRPLLSRVFAVPGAVGALPDVERCRYVTLWHLVSREDLVLISVWNPSFLTLLMDALERHGEQLAEDLERGTCRPPDADEVRGVLARMRFSPRPERAAALRSALRHGLEARELWPRLSLLSMWTDAQAAHAVPSACRRFSGVEVQGKGLLATEGVVTVPLFDAPAPVLAVRSHFFEFIDAEHPDVRPRLAHELERGRTYTVLLSTSGGLLRYRLGDLVRVEGFRHATPCLRFLGRADAVCDLVGEKLSATRVAAVLDAMLPSFFGGVRPDFAMLAPEWQPGPPAYRLFLDTAAPDSRLAEAAAVVERALLEGHHYRYARELGQLGPVLAVRVSEGVRRYEARCIALGQRAGDIKPMDLHRQPGWSAHFSGVAA